MPDLFTITSAIPQFVPPLVGMSVYGFTASVGTWLTDEQRFWNAKVRALFTPDEKKKLLAPPVGIQPAHRTMESRRWLRRFGPPVRVVVADSSDADLGTGWVVDRSSGGLGFQLDQPLEVGTVLKVRPYHAPGLKLWLEGVVKNCQDQEDFYKVGCQFVQTPPVGILRLFG
jgi:hypothetical protein